MKNMASIKKAIDGLLQDLGLTEAMKSKMALYYWKKVAGEKISRVTEPLNVKDGKLFVSVKNDIWRNELIYYKKSLISKLNKELKGKYIKDIIFV